MVVGPYDNECSDPNYNEMMENLEHDFTAPVENLIEDVCPDCHKVTTFKVLGECAATAVPFRHRCDSRPAYATRKIRNQGSAVTVTASAAAA